MSRKRALKRARRAKKEHLVKRFKKPVSIDENPPGLPEAIYCPKCGDKIKGMVPYGNEVKTVLKDRTMIYQTVRLLELPTYAEITIEFIQDGIPSAHVTHMCKRCANTLTGEELEMIYGLDMEEFAEKESSGHGDVLWEHWVGREITGYKVNR